MIGWLWKWFGGGGVESWPRVVVAGADRSLATVAGADRSLATVAGADRSLVTVSATVGS